MQSLQVSILGQQFNLRSSSSPEDVQRIAAYVERQIQEVAAGGRVADTLQATVLALLNVSARYLAIDPCQFDDAARRVEGLVVRLEGALSTGCLQDG